MQKYLLLIVALSACLALVSAAPKKAAAKKTVHKLSCTTCRGPGDDCTSSHKENNCDKCYYFRGIANDPSKVPPFIWTAMGPGAKEAMTANKGKKLAFRGCAKQEQIDVIMLGEPYDEFGCSDFDDEEMGVKEGYGCLCQGDCKL